MKKLLVFTALITLASCGPRRPGKLGAAGSDGKDGIDGINGQDGYSLVATSVPSGIGPSVCSTTTIFQDIDRNNIVSIADVQQSMFITCNGTDGTNGLDGQDGQDGADGQDGLDGQDGANGQDGQDGLAGADGQDGADGVNGQDGQNGTNGKSSYEIALDHGFVGSELDYLSSLQGQQGLTGAQGPLGPQGPQGIQGVQGDQGIQGPVGPQGPAGSSTYSIVEIIDPCGDAPGKYDEVILKLANGQYLASFSDNASGLNTRFGILPTGTYQTTDGTGCTFSIP